MPRAARSEVGSRLCGFDGPGHVAHDGRKVEPEHALVLGVPEAVGPQARFLRVGLHQLHLLVFAAGELEVVDRLPVDVEHRRGGAVFRGHVGDRGAVAEGERGGAFAVELEICADHLLLAQELGQREHDIGRGDAGARPARELHADDVRQSHPRGAAEHHVLGFEATDTDRDHAERIDVRRVAVGSDQRVGERDAVLRVDHRRHPLQVDLVHDAVARRDHVDVPERLLRPVDEVEAVLVAALLDGTVLREGVLLEAAVLHRERVVHDQLHRHDGIDLRRIATLLCNRIPQAREIHERRLAEDVVAHDARREPREIEVTPALDELPQRRGQGRRVATAHEILGQHARRIRQLVVRAGLERVDRGSSVEVVELGAGQGFAVCGVHGDGRGKAGKELREVGR